MSEYPELWPIAVVFTLLARAWVRLALNVLRLIRKEDH